MGEMSILNALTRVLEERKHAQPGSSYVATLYSKGMDAILKKIAEESGETIIAAKNGDPHAIVHEIADLWFHTMVLLVHEGLAPKDVIGELERRFGLSGLEEKAARKQS